MPPLAMMIPESTNIGTARSGKLSIPPSMERITNCPLAVKDGSKAPGRTDAIVSAIDTGMAMIRQITNKINTTAAGMLFLLSHLFLLLLLILQTTAG